MLCFSDPLFKSQEDRSLRLIVVLVVFALAAVPTMHAATSSFETLADGEVVTTQLTGLTFSNTIALTAGISLNEFEFPPRSGSVVVSDNGGPISIQFAVPVITFAGFFTYSVPLTLTAFDVLDNPVGSASSSYSTNLALSGDLGSSTNERLEVMFAGGIARVVIAGYSGGGSFTLDDAEHTASNSTMIPEPSTRALAILGLGAAAVLRKRAHLAPSLPITK